MGQNGGLGIRSGDGGRRGARWLWMRRVGAPSGTNRGATYCHRDRLGDGYIALYQEVAAALRRVSKAISAGMPSRTGSMTVPKPLVTYIAVRPCLYRP